MTHLHKLCMKMTSSLSNFWKKVIVFWTTRYYDYYAKKIRKKSSLLKICTITVFLGLYPLHYVSQSDNFICLKCMVCLIYVYNSSSLDQGIWCIFKKKCIKKEVSVIFKNSRNILLIKTQIMKLFWQQSSL